MSRCALNVDSMRIEFQCEKAFSLIYAKLILVNFDDAYTHR